MSEQTASFSVSVPIGAWHPFLRDCLESLKAQEGPLEVALLDASNDPRVRDLADEFASILAYRRHGPDSGQSDAIIEGWNNTSGDILGWLNADDLLFPNALRAARAAFANDPALGLVYGHSTILDDKKRTVGYHWAVEPPGSRLLESGVISQPSCFFRRDAYERTGGLNADLHYAMDWDLWIRLYKSGVKFGFIDDVLSMVLWAEGTKTASFNKQRRDELSKLIRENAPKKIANKVMRSFAIHNAVEKLPPLFRKVVARALIRGRKEIYGLCGDGLINDSATLYLVHYDETPKRRLLIEADNSQAITNIEINGAALGVARISSNAMEAALPAPVFAGQTVRLAFRVKQGTRVYFNAAEWL